MKKKRALVIRLILMATFGPALLFLAAGSYALKYKKAGRTSD